MKEMEIKPYERLVNYYETDKMGIVHHSNYIRYFEEARLDFMERVGCGVVEMEQSGVIIPNVDAYARYRRVTRFGDRLTVTVRPAEFTGARMRFEYEIISGGKLCCDGYTTHCFVNGAMKPIILKHTHPELFKKLSRIFEECNHMRLQK